VTRTAYGGSCYLNNAAVAAQALRDGGATRVAILDVDAHHGNGAQAIFSGRDDVCTASVHVDPAAGWFPHYVGFADESDDANLNVPLAPGSGDATWLAAVQELAAFAQADALVVALGVDAAATDPESPLRVSPSGVRIAGQILGGLALPTVLVQEGGYDLASIGELVRELLVGFEEGMGSARE
jgi:acetoin utilization deacetylase AcuC-like enzyme